ncbi:hypothetical protein EGW08_001075 [Elysia chlorotica]|uniref:PDZ domain-containing protein n=1 Tax=Elysia chlorotica TaxID=188477 RepID=A0A433UBM3_ELYCH|nr:hypothetical protein EGW08_001075 [Elysia chlorotica]
MSALKTLKQVSVLRGSVGADLQDLAKDRAIVTDPEETRRRRTIRLTRQHLRASWGFTLQTYGIRNKRSREVEVMSYVDYVEMNGPAFRAGMKKGDVILSVNGESVDTFTHRDLVTRIQRGGRELRLVVLFEDCCKKVELQERYIRLKKLLNVKLKELRRLEGEESRLLRGGSQLTSLQDRTSGESLCSTPSLLSRLSALRQSALSHSSAHSSASSDWDVYSEILSPVSLEDVRVNKFAFDSSLSDVSYVSSNQGSNGSVSISLSSDSQSEHKVDVAGDSRHGSSANEISGKDMSRGSKLSSNGQGEESELDISISTGQDDGDTDSETSFSLSASSPLEESNTHSESPPVDDENFRHMYTVARWVGMNTGLVRRRSLGAADIFVGTEVNGTSKTRVLGSLKETGEEGLSSDNKTHDAIKNITGEDRGEECSEDKSSSTITPTARGSTLQPAQPQNFYIESDSEESSVLSGHTGRTRTDTVIDVRDVDATNGHNSSSSSAGQTSSGDEFSTPVKEGTLTTYASSDTTRSEHTSAVSNNGSSNADLGYTVEPVKDDEDTSTNSHKRSGVCCGSESRPINQDQQQSNGDPKHQGVTNSSQSNLSLRMPRYVQGVLVNDQTYLTRL